MTNKNNIVPALIIACGIFILDIQVPIGYAVYLLYLIPIFLTAPALEPLSVLFLPAIGTVLTIASYFLEPPGGDLTRAMINRGLGIFALWAISFIIMMRRKAEDALRESRQQLIHIIDADSVMKQTTGCGVKTG